METTLVVTNLSAMLFSLAGIPITAGFMGKFYLVASGVEATRVGLVGILGLNSTIGLFYYLRIIAVMFVHSPVINLLVTAFG
ncbi:MAG: hypothetical protein MIO92_11125 [Methanosarcinaceae archaeon]|nr:hypothetical protein [Methanosarcinaceae archaeon]